jgi:hypothetical protein
LRLAASAPSGPEWLHVAAKPEQLGESVTPPGGAPLPDFGFARSCLQALWSRVWNRDSIVAADINDIQAVLDAAELALASQQQRHDMAEIEIRSLREERITQQQEIARLTDLLQHHRALTREAHSESLSQRQVADRLRAQVEEALAILNNGTAYEQMHVPAILEAGLSPRGEPNG